MELNHEQYDQYMRPEYVGGRTKRRLLSLISPWGKGASFPVLW